jgi:hypothetical protein
MREVKDSKYETKLESNAKRAVRLYVSGLPPFEACRKAGVSYNIGLKHIQDYKDGLDPLGDDFFTPSKDFVGVKMTDSDIVEADINHLYNMLMFVKTEKTTKEGKEKLLRRANELLEKINRMI